MNIILQRASLTQYVASFPGSPMRKCKFETKGENLGYFVT